MIVFNICSERLRRYDWNHLMLRRTLRAFKFRVLVHRGTLVRLLPRADCIPP
jgi:hypothetical protein